MKTYDQPTTTPEFVAKPSGNRSNCSVPKRRVPIRKGLATLEVAMCLIILSAILSVMFFVFSYVYTASGVAVASRHHAWDARHRPWESHPKVSMVRFAEVSDGEFSKILGRNPLQSPAKASVSEPSFPVNAFGRTMEISSRHAVFSGTWAHQEVKFKRHRRLVGSDKFSYFTGGYFAKAAFSVLAGVGR